MMAHSFLHAGPAVYGLSPAFINYLISDSIDAMTILDVPDFELRQALVEVSWGFLAYFSHEQYRLIHADIIVYILLH